MRDEYLVMTKTRMPLLLLPTITSSSTIGGLHAAPLPGVLMLSEYWVGEALMFSSSLLPAGESTSLPARMVAKPHAHARHTQPFLPAIEMARCVLALCHHSMLS